MTCNSYIATTTPHHHATKTCNANIATNFPLPPLHSLTAHRLYGSPSHPFHSINPTSFTSNPMTAQGLHYEHTTTNNDLFILTMVDHAVTMTACMLHVYSSC